MGRRYFPGMFYALLFRRRRQVCRMWKDLESVRLYVQRIALRLQQPGRRVSLVVGQCCAPHPLAGKSSRATFAVCGGFALTSSPRCGMIDAIQARTNSANNRASGPCDRGNSR